MKRNLIYIGLAAIAGILIGYLIFGSSSHSIEEHNHELELSENGMWTCSMHPQIMQKEPGSCPICSMDLIPVESSEEELSANQIKISENALALANVQTTVVGSEFVKDNTLKLSGKIVENEESNTAQTAHFGGRLEKLYINSTGEEIRKGQLLALIYSPELVAAQQELFTALDLKSTQPDLYNAVRQKLKLWKLSDKQIQTIETSGKIIENFPVYSNVSGVVSKKMVEEGSHVTEGQALLKITNLNTVWAEFDAYENQITLLKLGQAVRIKANAYPNTDFNSEISFIEPILNTATRTVMIRTVLLNTQRLFKPGMFVEGIIEIEENDETPIIIIPKSAVLWTGKRSLVYVKPDSDRAVFEMREVTLGSSLGDSYEIKDGLNPGDEVVVNGAFTIDAAAQLQGKKSMMNVKEGDAPTGHEGHTGMQPGNATPGHENHKMKETEEGHQIEISLSESFQGAFLEVITDYIDLKDAFVSSEVEKVKTKASKVFDFLKEINVSSFSKIENQYITTIKSFIGTIIDNSSIEIQRDQFRLLSDEMIQIVSNMGNLENKLFVQFCPMADNEKGVSWLSYEEKIINPYFGNIMLNCGEIKKEFN